MPFSLANWAKPPRLRGALVDSAAVIRLPALQASKTRTCCAARMGSSSLSKSESEITLRSCLSSGPEYEASFGRSAKTQRLRRPVT